MSENPYREACGDCGARRIDAQLGLERTPEEYTERLVGIFREVRRVLTSDGTLWLNLGDCYASNLKGSGGASEKQLSNAGSFHSASQRLRHGLKEKDLVGIPWRVAFALQADGWWLRSDIIWAKPNPMPESVTDRPTRAHEYLFLLTKSARYYYDAEAIKEPAEWGFRPTRGGSIFDRVGTAESPPQKTPGCITFGGGKQALGPRTYAGFNERWDEAEANGSVSPTRNRRTVWEIATQPFPEAHFATFPEALVEPCILAGSAAADTVLDPFAGSGTVGVVALRHGREFVGIELNPSYVEMAERRIVDSAPLFNTVRST